MVVAGADVLEPPGGSRHLEAPRAIGSGCGVVGDRRQQPRCVSECDIDKSEGLLPRSADLTEYLTGHGGPGLEIDLLGVIVTGVEGCNGNGLGVVLDRRNLKGERDTRIEVHERHTVARVGQRGDERGTLVQADRRLLGHAGDIDGEIDLLDDGRRGLSNLVVVGTEVELELREGEPVVVAGVVLEVEVPLARSEVGHRVAAGNNVDGRRGGSGFAVARHDLELGRIARLRGVDDGTCDAGGQRRKFDVQIIGWATAGARRRVDRRSFGNEVVMAERVLR